MKKNLCKLYGMVIALILALLSVKNVYAVSNMTITTKNYIKTTFSDGTTRKEAYYKTNKGIAYCITPSKTGGPQGTSLAYSSKKTSGALLYILSKAGTSNDSYLNTQLALWKYNNNFIPAAYNKKSSIVNNATSLANEAKKHENFSSTPSLSVSTTTLSFTESSDGKYYVSNTITVKLSNASSTSIAFASAPNDSIIVGSDGKTKTTLSDGDNITIKVPTSSVSSSTTIKVTLKVTGYELSYERYSGGKWQDLIVLIKTEKTISKELSGNITPVVRKCEYTNGKYYDKNGNVTDKTTYSIQCERHTCEKVGDTYFGKSGSQVTADQYDLECNTHTCEKVGDTYFGKSGTQVTADQYDLECNTHTCEVVSGKYFGKSGTEITADQYNLECNTHKCEIVNGNYFDANGNLTDEATYKSQCETVVPVPDTADSNNLVYTVLGILFIGGTVLGIRNYKKNNI